MEARKKSEMKESDGRLGYMIVKSPMGWSPAHL